MSSYYQLWNADRGGFLQQNGNVALFKDTEGSYFTFDEYKKLIENSQTDKNKNLIYLYSTNKEEQHGFIEIALNKGYSVLLMDNMDVALIGMLEQKFGQTAVSCVLTATLLII